MRRECRQKISENQISSNHRQCLSIHVVLAVISVSVFIVQLLDYVRLWNHHQELNFFGKQCAARENMSITDQLTCHSLYQRLFQPSSEGKQQLIDLTHDFLPNK